MRRRDIVAGIGSVGVLAGAGGAVLGGAPSFGADRETDASADGDDGSITVETIDARGSEAGTVTLPNGGVTVAMLFVTGCGFCQATVPNLAAAHSRLRDEGEDRLTFLSATYQSRETKPPAELRAWWRDHGGNWAVGYDSTGDLASAYRILGYPVTVVIDDRGEKRWEKRAVPTPDEVVAAVEPVLAESAERTGGGTTDTDSNASPSATGQ